MERQRVQANITAYWNARGATYDSQPGHGIHGTGEHAAWLRALAALLPPPPADILDVGAGTGFLSLLLAELGHRVLGLDLAEGMLAQARRKAARLPQPPAFRVGDAHAPDLPPASVDVVASRHLLWTLADPAAAFAAWRRLLRPGGRVLAIDGLWWADGRATVRGATTEPWQIAWETYYSDAVQQELPLMHAQSLEPILAAVRAAGFVDVRVSRLEEIERIERNTKERSDYPSRYVITVFAGA